MSYREELIAFVKKVSDTKSDHRDQIDVTHHVSVSAAEGTPSETTYTGTIMIECGYGYFSGVCVRREVGDPTGPGAATADPNAMNFRKDGLAPEQAVDLFIEGRNGISKGRPS